MSASTAELTDRQRKALIVLRDEAAADRMHTHPARLANLLDGPGRSGAGWRSTLDSLERKGLVAGTYKHYSGGRVFTITDAGLAAIQ